MTTIKEQSATSKLASASGVLAGAMLAASVGNYGINVVLAGMLSPAQFGDASLMVTSMLALSSIAVGIQLLTVKHVARHEPHELVWLGAILRRRAVMFGMVLGGVLALCAPWLSTVLQTASVAPFLVLALGLPAFLGLAVDRGLLQGQFRFARMAATYLVEAAVRVVSSLVLVVAGFGATGATWGLTLSFGVAWFLARDRGVSRTRAGVAVGRRRVSGEKIGSLGVLLIAQVVINNGDVILSKQLLDPDTAGGYAAIALIGRAVFFASWAVVQAVFPSAVTADGNDESLTAAATKLVAGIGIVSVVGIAASAPLITSVLLGDSVGDMGGLLTPYAAATALFAVANVIATIDVAQQRRLGPTLLLGGAVGQTAAIALLADSAYTMVWIQVGAMGVLALVVGATCAFRWYNGHTLFRVKPRAAKPRLVAHS